MAAAVSHVFSGNVIVAIWLWVIVTFAAVETIELIRGYLRIQAYGWNKGLLSYSISQWSRNFTFGMLLAFTIKIQLSGSWLKSFVFDQLRAVIIQIDTVIVFILLFFEVFLLAKSLISVDKINRTSKLALEKQ